MITTGAAPTIVAGWYPDPAGDAGLRWWDGAAWTEHVHAAEPADLGPAPGDTMIELGDPGTRWAWLLVASPYIWAVITGLAQAATFGTLPMGAIDSAQLTALGTITMIVGLLPGWLFAALDRRELIRRNYDGVPSLLWMLLLPPFAYLLHRRAAVRREGARTPGLDIATLVVGSIWGLKALAGIGLLVVALVLFPMPAAYGGYGVDPSTEETSADPVEPSPTMHLEDVITVGTVDPASPTLERDVAAVIEAYTGDRDWILCDWQTDVMVAGDVFTCVQVLDDADLALAGQLAPDGTVTIGNAVAD